MAGQRIQVKVSETGQGPFSVRIDAGGHDLTGDEPVEAGGGGLGPNPFGLLTSALAECTVMTVRWYARQKRWPVEHVAVTVDYAKKRAENASSLVDEKTVFIRGPQLTREHLNQLIDIAAKCPVQRVLEGSPSIETQLGATTGQAAE